MDEHPSQREGEKKEASETNEVLIADGEKLNAVPAHALDVFSTRALSGARAGKSSAQASPQSQSMVMGALQRRS